MGKRHDAIVAAIDADHEAEGWKHGIKGARQAIRDLAEKWDFYTDEILRFANRIPDCWFIMPLDDGRECLVYVEVECGWRVPEDKMRNYADMWFCFNDVTRDVVFDVVRLNQDGQFIYCDIGTMFAEFLIADAKEKIGPPDPEWWRIAQGIKEQIPA